MKKKKSKAKRIMITAALIIAAGAAGAVTFNSSRPQKNVAAVSVKTMPLFRQNMTENISVSGAIYSANTQNIYSSQNYTVKEVNVKVGDKVKTGDILAVLDMSSIDYELKQAENDITGAQISASEEQQTLANNIANAEISLEASKLSLDKQQINYDNLVKELNNGTSTELVNAQNAIDTAQTNLNSAKKDITTKEDKLASTKLLYSAGSIAKSELDADELAYANAQDALTAAENNYNKAVAGMEKAKTTLAQNVETAKKELENAKLSYKSAQNSLTQAKSKNTSSEISLDNKKISLEKLQEQLGKDKIIATMDGTITEVNAVVGSSPTGILFVIEDMDDLYVSANVYEYDLSKISEGQDANVTTDATENQIFSGQIEYISPKAVSAAGSTTVEFETHIGINGKNPMLRIGMNAFVDIILASRENVYAVSYAALNTKPNGESSVYVLENNVVKEIPVETGLETSTSVEISGEGLSDGMKIVINPAAVTVGQTIDASMQAQGSIRFQSNASGDSDGETMTRPAGEMPAGRGQGGNMPIGGARIYD